MIILYYSSGEVTSSDIDQVTTAFFLSLVAGVVLATLVSTQYFPPRPEGSTFLRSRLHEGVNITFKNASQL